MPVKVQKKDGSTQDFDRNKVLNGVMKSGATAEEAEKVTQRVEAWAPTAAVNGLIAALSIRAKVLEFLKAVNPVAGVAFEAYQKPAPPPPAGGPVSGPVQPPPTPMVPPTGI